MNVVPRAPSASTRPTPGVMYLYAWVDDDAMEFGLKPNYAWPKTGRSREQFERTIEQARVGVVQNFGSIWFPHQYINTDFNRFQPIPTFGRMTSFVEDNDLGTTFVLPLHNPVMVAENFATLDNQFDGTLYLAAIQGYKQSMFDAFDVDKDDRLGRFVESIQILRKLWTEDNVSFSGRHFNLDDVTINPKPDGEIPIIIGGNVESAIERAGKLGSGYLISSRSSLEAATELTDIYREAKRNSDYPHRGVMLNRDMYVAETTEQAIEDIRPMMVSRIETYQERGADDINEEIVDIDEQIDDYIGDRLVGSPEEVIAKIERWRDAVDPDVVVCGNGLRELPHDQLLDSIQRFNDEVIPYFGE